MKTVNNYNFNGKRALIRVDFNVPLDKDFNIKDDTRLKAAIPTISKILKDGGSVVLMSHLGRPKNGPEEKYSLKHLIKNLKDTYHCDVLFASDCVGKDSFELSSNLKKGDILVLENLRFHNEEEKGDINFAKKLSKHGDCYVNDAFGTAHRAHASTSIIAQFFPNNTICGYVIEAELKNAKKVLENVEKPYTAIMGGAKISDKILIIEKLLDKIDHLIIGGGMSYTFFKALGGKIGNSLVEHDKLDLAKKLIEKAKEKAVEIHLPFDSIVADKFDNEANTLICSNFDIPEGYMGLDIGPQAREVFSNVIKDSKTILWNGPMGVFEMSNFAEGTNQIAKAVANATEKGAFSLIGGGDSASAINNLGYGEKVSYVSTGGGALLEYMEGKKLPGITILE